LPFSPRMDFWLPFMADNRLKKISILGGEAITLCEWSANLGRTFRGVTWREDGQIVFATEKSGLWQISSAGSAPKLITGLKKDKGEVAHRFPQTLPDAQAVLFTCAKKIDDCADADIEV
jgi:eukaryotic-like serine/threonine-protein kinase